MKHAVRIATALFLTLAIGSATWAHKGAGFSFKGEGETLEFSPENLPGELQTGYTLLKKTCTKCHSQARIVRHLQDNITKGADYESNLESLIMKKLQMSSGVSKAEGKAIMDFLLALYRIEIQEHLKLKPRT